MTKLPWKFFVNLSQEGGDVRSVVDFQAEINRYIDDHNDQTKRFVWTKTAKSILTKTARIIVPSECVSALEQDINRYWCSSARTALSKMSRR